MPLTKEQERSFLASKGYNPDDYTLVETPDSYELKPLVKTQPTAISQPFGVTEQAQQSNLTQDQAPKPDDSMSGLRAFATTVGRGLAPAGAGLAVGALLAPFTEGLSLLPSLLATGTGMGLASYGAAKLQEPLLENTPLSQSMALQAEQAHPYAALAGSVAPNLIAMKPSPGLAMQAGQSTIRGLSGKALSNLERANLQNVAAGAVLPTASNAYQSIAETGQLPSATDLMRDAALGALISNPNALGRKVFGMHEMPSNVLPYDPRAQGNQQLRGEQMPLQDITPAQQPISTPIDNMLAARNKVLAENVYPLTDKGIKRAERAQEGVVANWHLPEEPGYAQQTMEGEGAPPVSKDQEELIAANNRRQMAEKNAELQKQAYLESHANREAKLAEVERGKIETELAGLQDSMKASQIQPETINPANPQRTNTRNVELANEQVAKESPADLASRQAEAQLAGESKPKYQPTEQKRVSIEEAPEQLSGVPKALVESMKRIGLTRNIQVDTTSGKLYNDKGVEINGKAWMENGLRKVVAQVGQGAKLDTLPHEITHHWFDDLATSPRKQDQALRQRVLDKVAQHPDYLAYKAENPAVSPEEYMVQATGERTVNDIRNSDSSLWKDLVSSVKARYSSQPKIADLARHLSSRVLTDAPHSEVYGDGIKNPRVAMVDSSEKNQTAAENPDVAKQKDIARHREIWDTIISNTAKDPEFAFSKEGQNLWKESEAIKNKYGGHVPGKEQPKDQPSIFKTSFEKELDNERPFGLTLAKDGSVPQDNLISRMKNIIPKDEYNAHKENGFEDFVTGKGERLKVGDIKTWMEENKPRVEVKKLDARGENIKDSKSEELSNEMFNLLHELDSNPISGLGNPGAATSRRAFLNRAENSRERWYPDLTDAQLTKVKRVEELNNILSRTPLAIGKSADQDSATARYTMVNPKPLDKMEGAVDILVRKPARQFKSQDDIPANVKRISGGGGSPLRESYKFEGSHFGSSDKNIIGWTRGYMETLPNGKKVFHVFELQSDWAQKIRDYGKEGNSTTTSSDNTLPYYESLALKAAIKHAIDNDADYIAVSDSKTAMLTEGHDKAKQTIIPANEHNIKQLLELEGENHPDYKKLKLGKDIDVTGDRHSLSQAKLDGLQVIEQIPQQKGMELHYDNTVPNILKKLTGVDKPTDVNFGEHQNAYEDKTSMENYSERTPLGYARKDLILKNNDGSPKTDITAKMFPLDNIKARIEKEPFSIYSSKYQPKDQPSVLPEQGNEKTFRPTSSAITKLRTEVKDERAPKLADAFTKTLSDKQALMASWWNPVTQAANKLTPEQASRVNEALVKARDTQTNVASSLPTLAETQAYNVAQAALKRTREYQQANNIPVYDTNGNPKKAGLDENYYPTTVKKEVADTIKEGTDAQAIGQLREDFIKKQMEGFKGKKVSEEEANARYEKLVSAIRGDALGVGGKTSSSTAFGAIRKVEGIPLPDSWRNNKLRDNLFSYFNRASTDLSFAKHVESNSEVAKALGYKQDLWGKDLGPSQGESLAGNEYVRNVLDSIQGKASLHDSTSMKEAAYESAASSFMIGGPLREIHVVGSSIANAFSYAKPTEALQTVAKGITQFVKGWETTLQTGASIEPKNADSLRTLVASDSSGADRVKAVSQMVRQISTLGGLTNKFSKGLLQVSGETIAEQRLAAVANGSGQVKQDAISYLKAIDPDYVEGKTYDQQSIQKLGSGFVDLIHGTHDARTLPNWMLKDTAVSAFFKMASWNIAQTNNFMKHVWTPATQGNFTPLLMATLGSVAGGALIKELREQVADKKAPYPSIKEVLAANEGKLDEHGIPLVAYNLMGMASFAGYAGILSSVAKSGFDVMYKNAPQGATFPLDEVVSNSARTLTNMLQAFKEGDDSFINIGLKATEDLFKQNSQLLRIASTWVDKSGLGGEDEKFKHQKTLEEADLRRFEEAKGIPYQAQTGSAPTNPYLNLKAERFKNNPDIEESLKELPGLIENIVNRYSDNPEILKSKLEGLKGSLSYKTMPNVEQDVYSFAKYYEYLEATKGKQEAAKILDNYMKNKLVNGIKSEVVPVF